MRFLLLQANKVDSKGDMFTTNCLRKMVSEFEKAPSIPVSTKFSGRPDDIYGMITKLELEGDDLYATMELLKTPLGDAMRTVYQEVEKSEKPLELAMGGLAKEKILTKKDGKEAYVFDDVTLTGADLVQDKVK